MAAACWLSMVIKTESGTGLLICGLPFLSFLSVCLVLSIDDSKVSWHSWNKFEKTTVRTRGLRCQSTYYRQKSRLDLWHQPFKTTQQDGVRAKCRNNSGTCRTSRSAKGIAWARLVIGRWCRIRNTRVSNIALHNQELGGKVLVKHF